MADKGFHWFRTLEFDLINTWPNGGEGLEVMHHIHIIAGCDHPIQPRKLAEKWSDTSGVSAFAR